MGRCDKCKHWSLYHMGPDDDFHPEDYEGECKRFPPTIHKDHGDDHPHYSDNFMFPTTVAHECCGEFTPSNAKAVGLAAAGGQSRTSDGLCVAVDTEKET